MKPILAVFASLNQVALLKRILYRQGVYVEMLRTPHCLSSTGCSFAIRCEAQHWQQVQEAYKEMQATPGGVFEETRESGAPQYVPYAESGEDR